MKTAILGGGLTGLTLGYLFNQNGKDFEILEKNEECGGLMRSLKDDGFTFDYGGSHIIFSNNEKVLNFILNTLGDNTIKNRRNTKILYKGRYVKYPFENGLADLAKEDNLICLSSFVRNLIDKERGNVKQPTNLKSWCYYTFGKGIAEEYLSPYNEKIWKYPIDSLGLDWVERIPNPPVEDVLKSSLGLETEGYTHQLYFYYPKIDGIQSIIKGLERSIKNRITTSFEVKEIKKQGERWLISDGLYEKEYDNIISTIPIFDLVNAINPDKIIVDTVNSLRYNSLITVMVGIDTPKINDFSWLYIPDKNILSHRVSFPSNFSPYAAPKGKSSALVEITCNVGDDIWEMKDEEIIARVLEDLDRLDILSKEQVCYAKTKRIRYAYVINDIGYRYKLNILEDYFNNLGIDLLGRFSEFKYLNMDGCIDSVLNYMQNMTG